MQQHDNRVTLTVTVKLSWWAVPALQVLVWLARCRLVSRRFGGAYVGFVLKHGRKVTVR